VFQYFFVGIQNSFSVGAAGVSPCGSASTIRFRSYAFLRGIFMATLLTSVSLMSGCKGCGKGDKIAELVAIQNKVFRDFASKTEKWQKASKGEAFAIGDGLKTDKNATARLQLLPKGQLVIKGDTIVRFQANPSGKSGQRLRVETGAIEIESQEIDLQVDTVVGLSRIGKGSRVRIRSTEKSSSFDVLVGAITVDSQGKSLQVASGKSLELDVGEIEIDRKEDPAAKRETEPVDDSTEIAEPSEEAEVDTPVDEDADRGYDRASTVADITISPGESATIHDPAPPTNIRVPIGNCESGGIVEVGLAGRRKKSLSVRGERDAIVRLPRGTHRYRVRCLIDGKPDRKALVRGRLSVRQDAAIRRLPKAAPTVQVEADGRPYTVRYQNLLPKIIFRWPDPAVSKAYAFHIKSEKGETRTKSSSRPETVYRSGQLEEGTHTFYFSTADGRRSANGRLRIAFDNTARTAYISEPVEGSPTPGQTVRVVGTALTHSKVSIGGRAVSVDSQGRFQTETVAPNQDKAIAIRVQRKTSDVHYYLRHLASNE
jgi:hypothetical protein